MTGSGGRLVVVATPIGNLGDLSPRAVSALRDADVIAAEDTRRTRALLSHAGVPARGRLIAVHGHNEARLAHDVVAAVRSGKLVAYATDSGTPLVSDPGERVVRACLDAGLAVEAVPGPSALLAALVVSGLPADRFGFEGFLPRKGPQRRARLEQIAASDRTVVLYEAPRRVAATLADLATACGDARPACVARELTKLHEEVHRGTLGGLAAGAAGEEPRGEHVIVVGPAAPPEQVTDEELREAVRDALARGETVRDAAGRVALDLGVPRRRVYEIAVKLAQSVSGSA